MNNVVHRLKQVVFQLVLLLAMHFSFFDHSPIFYLTLLPILFEAAPVLIVLT